jgi:hypothetical protein
MKKIKCYYFWNKQFVSLKKVFELTMEYFTSNIQMIPVELKFQAKTSDFLTLDFKNIILEKTKKVKNIIESNLLTEKEILISDVDIVIYNNFEHLLQLNEYDIIFQKENKKFVSNTGFIFLKCNKKVLSLWEKIIEIIEKTNPNAFTTEQRAIKQLLLEDSSQEIKYKHFEDSIWAYSNPPQPSTILLHHANVTLPTEQKSSYELKVEQIKKIINTNNHPLKEKIFQII